MSASGRRSFRFATAAQWDACLCAGVNHRAEGGAEALRPHAAYASPAARFETAGARAPAVTGTGDLLWRDDRGCLHRLRTGDEVPATFPGPAAIVSAGRVVATADSLWVAENPPPEDRDPLWAGGEQPPAHRDGGLQRHDDDTLAQVLAVCLEDARILDLASAGHGGVLALVERGDATQVVRVDATGHVRGAVALEGVAKASAVAFLRRSRRLVLLTAEPSPRLCWFRAEGGTPIFSVQVGALRPCFRADALASDGRDRVFVAGRDAADLAGQPAVVLLDGDGTRLGDLPLDPFDAPVTGLAASGDVLAVTGPRGLLRFTAASVVPGEAPEARCTVLTPMLQAPEGEDHRRWLRLEALATLPSGTTLELSAASTDDPELRDRLAALASDPSVPPAHRIQRLLGEPGLSWATTVVPGSDAATPDPEPPRAAPLFDLRGKYLWACATLVAAPGAALPSLRQLEVVYPGRSLMEDLPAVFRRQEVQPGSFLRGLVGVLETTTQGLDDAIASLGRRVHPETAEGVWLDFVARWLGLPWDDAMAPAQKSAVLRRAPELALGRGTRAALEALLEALIPGTPRRFRVSDPTADRGFAVVGGAGCAGSALPALLAGPARWSAQLDAGTFLGAMRLPCPGRRDDSPWLGAGRVWIEVAASAEERVAWEPWLPSVISEVLPLTARAQLLWVSALALRGDRLEDGLILEPPPEPHLGTDAITGLARLPSSRTRLPASGLDLGSRLF